MIKKGLAAMAALLFMSFSPSVQFETCEQQAADYLEAYEYHFGCQDAETANWIYNTQLGLCRLNRGEM